MNFVIFQGHLVDKPVLRKTEDGKSWCSGKIGVYQGKDKNGNDLESMFIEFSCYASDAETLGNLGQKGDLVVISGTFRETSNTAENGITYHNKRVSGNAKLCVKKPATQQPVQYQQPMMPQQPVQYQQPMAMPQQPMMQQPVMAQQPMMQQPAMPQQNINPWG